MTASILVLELCNRVTPKSRSVTLSRYGSVYELLTLTLHSAARPHSAGDGSCVGRRPALATTRAAIAIFDKRRKLLFSFFLRMSVVFTQFAQELILLAANSSHIIVGELAPLLFNLTFYLVPFSFKYDPYS